jgi:DNA-binding response OmpR family regulator
MNNIPVSILLIENNTLSRQNMAAFLESFGYLVTQTEDGEEAIKLINDIKFDVVITDLQLQCMVDGLDILAGHKKVSPEAKSFLITAFGSDEVRKQAASLGAIYVEKPIRLSELVALLRAGA